ncbi:MFS transporter [Salininema proteolyticum]|uniref:MFS transporter n=1 Tax=Salininema proteolyticum TaxID=1607685 RepID=A0ABV8TZ37_9ACTN
MGELRSCGLLRHREARTLWVASAFASAGMWLLQIATALFVLSVADASTLAVVQLCGALPGLFATPLAGWVADRLPVRRVCLACQGVQVLAAIGMGVSALHGDLVSMALLFAVQSAAMAFWAPTRQQWLYAVVEPDLRQRANAALGSLNGAMVIVGALGAGVASALSASGGVFAAASLFGLCCAALVLLREPGPALSSEDVRLRSTGHGFLSGLVAGFAAARHYPLARSVIWIGIAWGFIGGGYTVMVSARLLEDLRGPAMAVSWAFVLDGTAVLVATMMAGRLAPHRRLTVWGAAYVVQGLAWTAFFLVPDLATALVILAVMRFAGGFIVGLDTTILLETVPEGLRGRVMALHITTYNTMARLSLAALGLLLGAVSLQVLGTVAGIAAALGGALWWAFARSLRTEDSDRD